MRYPDFLRNIVNPKLSKYVKTSGEIAKYVEEIRKRILETENKYGFSIYGGDPEKLKDYLLSEDFKLIMKLFKSANSLSILEEILVEAKNRYSDLPNVVEAVDRVLEMLKHKQGV